MQITQDINISNLHQKKQFVPFLYKTLPLPVQPRLDQLQSPLLVQVRMHHQLRTVRLDNGSGGFHAEHPHQIRANFQRGDRSEVRRARVLQAAAEDTYSTGLALVAVVGERRRQLSASGG